jgi:hypothetical protein
MSDRPRPLQWLIDRLSRLVSTATDALEQGGSVIDWRDTVARLLTRYSAAALQAGQNGAPLDEAGKAAVVKQVQAQIGFLDGFAAEIQDAPQFEQGWKARAEMYAKSIAAPYWSGRTKMLPLPALPGDGTTQCLGNCTCTIEVDWIDEENGDADVYWRLGASERHCQTCPQRAQDWSPLRIRNGELQ